MLPLFVKSAFLPQNIKSQLKFTNVLYKSVNEQGLLKFTICNSILSDLKKR